MLKSGLVFKQEKKQWCWGRTCTLSRGFIYLNLKINCTNQCGAWDLFKFKAAFLGMFTHFIHQIWLCFCFLHQFVPYECNYKDLDSNFMILLGELVVLGLEQGKYKMSWSILRVLGRGARGENRGIFKEERTQPARAPMAQVGTT